MFNSTLDSDESCSGFNPGGNHNLLMPVIGSFPVFRLLLGENQNGSDNGGATSSLPLFLTCILLLICNYSLGYLTGYLAQVLIWIKGRFIYSIVIESNDEIFQWVFEYINRSRVAKRANEVSAHSAWSNNSKKKSHYHSSEVNPFKDSQQTNRPNLYFLPYYGMHYCNVGGYRVFISRTKKEEQKMIMDSSRNRGGGQIEVESEIIQISTFAIS